MSMIRWSWLLLGIAASMAANAQGIKPAVVSPGPHPVRMQALGARPGMAPIAPQQTMTVWRAGAATCGAEPVPPMRAPNPLPSLSWGTASEAPLRFAFRIDERGRPLGVRQLERRYVASAGDVAPALASALFAPGRPREGCTIDFTAERMQLDQVPVGLAMAYTVFPTAGRPPAALWQRIRPADATCYEPTPALLNRAYPDFTAIDGEEGRPLWSMTGYDIDAGGRPVHVRTVDGSRSALLDAAARRAVEQSRFGKGARHGCLYPYWKIADPMAAPEPPSRDSAAAQSEACKALGEWVRAPRLSYPDNYRRRGIEGWAIVAYDVAPWGALGNVRVIASEPTSDFGDAATAMFAGLSRKPSEAGASGCVERVRYVMAKPGTSRPSEDPATLY